MDTPQRVQTLLDVRRFVEAEQAAVAALAYDPRDPLLLYLLAQAAFGQGENDEAIVHAQQALAVAPDWYQPWWTITVAQLALNDRRAARKACEQILNLAPQVGAAHALYGVILAASWRKMRALAYVERAVELSPEDPEVLIMVATVYRDCDMPLHAEYVSSRAVHLAPESSNARQALGMAIASQRNRTPEALHHLVAASISNPNDGRARAQAVLIARRHIGRDALLLAAAFVCLRGVVTVNEGNWLLAVASFLVLIVLVVGEHIYRQRKIQDLPPGLYELVRATEQTGNLAVSCCAAFWFGIIIVLAGAIGAMFGDIENLYAVPFGVALSVVCRRWWRKP